MSALELSARDHLRKGEYLRGLAWRFRSVWRHPRILGKAAPAIMQTRLGLRPVGSTH